MGENPSKILRTWEKRIKNPLNWEKIHLKFSKFRRKSIKNSLNLGENPSKILWFWEKICLKSSEFGKNQFKILWIRRKSIKNPLNLGENPSKIFSDFRKISHFLPFSKYPPPAFTSSRRHCVVVRFQNSSKNINQWKIHCCRTKCGEIGQDVHWKVCRCD
jgi:hypothetical protein